MTRITSTTKDDLKIWKIALCDSCMPSSYKVFLQTRIRKSLGALGICSLCLAIVIVFLFVIPAVFPHAKPSGITGLIGLVVMGVSMVIGTIGVPVNLIILIVNSGRLRHLNQTGAIPENSKTKSFIGEGQTLIKKMETNRSAEMDVNLPLPRFRLKDLPLSDKEQEMVLVLNKTHGKGERNIIAAAMTLQELEKALPLEWRSILKTTQ
ncbi:hypothetical protein IMZ68_00280 [Candidatus Bathyarchaeota archaeon]|nr:hypothetical protein [Candidatus Bathyarchaeota archaeon]